MSEKEVSQPIRFIVPGYVFRKFTFIERLKLLLGHTLVLELYIACQHNPGRTQPVSHVHISPINDEREAILAVQQDAIDKKRIAAPQSNKEGVS